MGDSSKHNPNRGAIAPFLSKCYEMVDDKATDAIVSWNPKDDSSFVIWDMIAFQTQVLPKYWKHGNFSSFMRQLNTYGFRKSDPDRWEFINDGFVKSQKHLLKNISRRKPAQNLVQQKHSQENDISVQTLVPQKQPQQENISVGTCVEVGKFRPLEEIEKLKQDKNVLMQELVTLSQQQEKADNKLHRLRQHLKGMELNQQQMLSLLAMAMQSPGFLIQLLQQNEFNWCIPEMSNKGLLPAPEHGTNGGGHVASERRIVKYQPRRNETPNHSLVPISNLDEFQQLDSSSEIPNHSLVPISNLDEFQQLDGYETPNHPVSTLDEFVQQLDSSSNGLEDLFMDIDMMSFAEGISASMDEDMLHENDHPFASPELLEDGMLEKLHPECPPLENGERIDPSSPEALEDGVEPKSTNHNTLLDSSPSLDLLTEQLRLPASVTKDMDP